MKTVKFSSENTVQLSFCADSLPKDKLEAVSNCKDNIKIFSWSMGSTNARSVIATRCIATRDAFGRI